MAEPQEEPFEPELDYTSVGKCHTDYFRWCFSHVREGHFLFAQNMVRKEQYKNE